MTRMNHRMNRRKWLSLTPGPLVSLASLAPLSAMRRAQAQVPLSIIMADLGPAEPLHWPRDHGAHLERESEWWAFKGEINQPNGQVAGFHLSFLRATIESAANSKSQFAPKQVLGARASLSDASKGSLFQDQRTARTGFGLADVSVDDMNIVLHDWSLTRSGPLAQSVIQARIETPDFTLDLKGTQTQPLMLHGENGYVRRERIEQDSTRYYSMPALKLEGQMSRQQKSEPVTGRAWLDHGWGRSQLVTGAAGSDWIGMHLHNGGVLMVFRMRREDGISVWESASLRLPGRADRIFKPEEIKITPGDTWRSPTTGATYPTTWKLTLAELSYTVKARTPNQEMDGGNGVGDVFWEGLSDLLDTRGHVVGSGYLEMNGYVPDTASR